MSVWIIFGIVVAGVATTALLIAALPQKPRHLTREEVANEIELFLRGTGADFDWDEFCTFTLADPELDRIRARCAQLNEEFPAGVSGGYCNEEGMKVLRGYVEQLRIAAA